MAKEHGKQIVFMESGTGENGQYARVVKKTKINFRKEGNYYFGQVHEV